MGDGKTFTDVLPHKLPDGYTQDMITSVERVIGGRHLTIKKSAWIENYFMLVDAGITLRIFGGGPVAGPPKIALKNIGGYVKDAMTLTKKDSPEFKRDGTTPRWPIGTESHLQFTLGMHPKTGDVVLEFKRVNKLTPVGINVKRIHAIDKTKPRYMYRHVVEGLIYMVFGSRDVKTANVDKNKMTAILKNGRVFTMTVVNQNITLEVT